MKNKTRNVPWTKLPVYHLFLLSAILILAAVSQGGCKELGEQSFTPNPGETGAGQNDTALLNSTFRIDIQTITVDFQYHPDQSAAEGEAEVVFRMRPGQTRPVIHFDGILGQNLLHSITLDGEPLTFTNPQHVRTLDVENSTQKAIEFQRTLDSVAEHRLVMRYRLSLPAEYPRFATDVNDLRGNGNEELFPTINSPEELARHRITFTVHGSRTYRFIGSGLTNSAPEGGLQRWTLDTEREIASYSVMFALMPAADTIYSERTIGGLPVRMMAYNSHLVSLDEAFASLEPWLLMLMRDFGPFPSPRGVSIFLTDAGGGMEYFGATISSLWALNHEVFHMYFACAVVQSTYRDSWLDEAINEWYEHSQTQGMLPIQESFRSNIVSGRSPVSVGFDSRAYLEGSGILQAVAIELGGRERMVAFLRYLVDNYMFKPFNTHRFLDYLQDFGGINMRTSFKNWLYSGAADKYHSESAAQQIRPPVNLSPPPEILERYQRPNGRNGGTQ